MDETPIDVTNLVPKQGEPWAPKNLRHTSLIADIEIISILLRLDQLAQDGFDVRVAETHRLWTCDIPRLINHISPETWEFLRQTLPGSWERLRQCTSTENAEAVYPL